MRITSRQLLLVSAFIIFSLTSFSKSDSFKFLSDVSEEKKLVNDLQQGNVLIGQVNLILDDGDMVPLDSDTVHLTYTSESDAKEISFKVIRPVDDQSEAHELYDLIKFIPTATLNSKELTVSFKGKDVTKVLQKRRGEFGDVYTLLVNANDNAKRTFQFNLVTQKNFASKEEFFKIIDSL